MQKISEQCQNFDFILHIIPLLILSFSNTHFYFTKLVNKHWKYDILE